MSLEQTLAMMENDPNAFCETNIDDYYLPVNHHVSTIINRHRAAGIANLDKYPDVVVLDLKKELKQFWDGVEQAKDFELDATETINEILLYIADINDAVPYGIPALCGDIKRIHTREGNSNDGDILAKHTMQLGIALYDKFKTIRAYTPEGLLPYELKGWLDSNSPYLVRSEDIGGQ